MSDRYSDMSETIKRLRSELAKAKAHIKHLQIGHKDCGCLGTCQVAESKLIDLEADCDRFREEANRFRLELDQAQHDRDHLKAELEHLSCPLCGSDVDGRNWKDLAEKAREYVVHERRCIRSFWEAGEPTPNGGYRMKFKDKWYQSLPVNEEPKCECGLDGVLAFFPPSESGREGKA